MTFDVCSLLSISCSLYVNITGWAELLPHVIPHQSAAEVAPPPDLRHSRWSVVLRMSDKQLC